MTSTEKESILRPVFSALIPKEKKEVEISEAKKSKTKAVAPQPMRLGFGLFDKEASESVVQSRPAPVEVLKKDNTGKKSIQKE